MDFRAICKRFRAIFIKDAKQVTGNNRNLSNRFIKLFDEAYFRQVKVYILSDEKVETLVIPPASPSNEEEFALVRCQSRLI